MLRRRRVKTRSGSGVLEPSRRAGLATGLSFHSVEAGRTGDPTLTQEMSSDPKRVTERTERDSQAVSFEYPPSSSEAVQDEYRQHKKYEAIGDHRRVLLRVLPVLENVPHASEPVI
jgi:hypothetical protein